MQSTRHRMRPEPGAPSAPAVATVRPSRRWLPDALGLAWVAAAGVAMLVPALVHGGHLGAFDLLTRHGLTRQPGVVIHNTYVEDQITAIMPWTNLVWAQVHQGHLPLWNPLSALGMPLAFNWQSAPFSVPALVGYLAPQQYAYTVGIIVTILIAGSGAYLFGRVLRLGVLGCAMAGTAFELSGPFVGWLGWPHATVFAWAGWLFAAALLVMRGGHRARAVAFFAVVLACAVYSGQPEILAQLLFALVVFVVIVLAGQAWRTGVPSAGRPLVDLGVATVAGGALAAPLALPGLQLASASVHSASGPVPALPLHDLIYFAFQGFDGLPLVGSIDFGPLGGYYTPAYVGVIALVLAVVAVAARRRSETVALAVVAVVGAVVALASATSWTASLMLKLPVVGSMPSRSLLIAGFALSMLAGVGLDALARSGSRRLWQGTGIGFAATGIGLVVLYLATIGGLSAAERRIRSDSFVWPVVGVAAAVGVVAAIAVPWRALVTGRPAPEGPGRVAPARARMAAVVLLLFETAFLVTAGAPLWSSSPTYFPVNSAEAALQRTVGSSLVGMGTTSRLCTGLGIEPNVNIVYGVHELALYDPMTPKTYFTSFSRLTGISAGFAAFNSYCPPIASARLARVYGVSYILERVRAPAPSGTLLVGTVGGEALYRVPGSAPATLTPLPPGGGEPAATALGRAVAVAHPGPASWTMTTRSTSPQLLRLRLADISGWHASIDGKPLALEPYAGIMLEARLPAGIHSIELHYWPDSFNVGLVLALCSLIGLSAALIVGERRRRSVTSRSEAGGPMATTDSVDVAGELS